MSSDSPPPTSRLCPACGLSDVPRSTCRICRGRGLATPAQIEAWSIRQKTSRTSSSLVDIPTQTREAIASLEARGTAQTAPLITFGRSLLAEFERSPDDADVARRLSDWLTAVQALLRGER